MTINELYLVTGICLVSFWSIRGFLLMIEVYNPLYVFFYLVLLFPIAIIHFLLKGMFGKSLVKKK